MPDCLQVLDQRITQGGRKRSFVFDTNAVRQGTEGTRGRRRPEGMGDRTGTGQEVEGGGSGIVDAMYFSFSGSTTELTCNILSCVVEMSNTRQDVNLPL